MIYKDLSAWITNSEGEQLEEFKQLTIAENTVECWIPSSEGSNFQIHWQPIRNFLPGLGLRCSIKLDGRTVSNGNIHPRHIARGIPGVKTGMSVSHSLKRPYVFGRRQITDRDDLASPDDPNQDSLGTIRISLSWVQYTDNVIPWIPNPAPEARLVHERAAKKGHASAAGLAEPVVRAPGRGYRHRKIETGFPEVIFVFKYGDRDWLQAKGVIPGSEQGYGRRIVLKRVKKEKERDQSVALSVPETLKSGSRRVKREHTQGLPEVIDVDELETDTDSDVVVLNDPVEPKRSASEFLVDDTLNREPSEVTAA